MVVYRRERVCGSGDGREARKYNRRSNACIWQESGGGELVKGL